MRKPVRNLLLAAGAAAILTAVGLIALTAARTRVNPQEVLQALAEATGVAPVAIQYPLDETLFPLDISTPCFRWKDDDPHADLWLVTIEFAEGRGRINDFAQKPEWRPEPAVWEEIKRRSVDRPARVTVAGVNRLAPAQVLSAGHVTIRTSADKVEAPLFYREVNLPFVEAVKDPTTIRWRFGTISSTQTPPVVLEKLPVCSNCHSFSADGSTLGMDVDYANDKGSYAIVGVRPAMTLDRSTIITWSDYKKKDGQDTFGLLSQVSPDGRFVVSTVKDRSVFVPKPDLDFSQLFFPIKGILCVYDRETRTFQSLPGADDPNLVQSNPTWSPDGRHIVFAATEAYHLQATGVEQKVLLSTADCREFVEGGKPFKFNLYRLPFNGGRGGKPEPIAGASFNGKSNYFARYSPDGRWIVFCKAENYMLLQPDSELYVIPAEGGEPRRLRANTKRMNSWHSFSPNGKWLVFSGKPDGPYTRLYLTHIDENGESTPPVVLDRLTAPDRAANIPEFVNVAPSAIRHIRERFIDDVSYARAAWEYYRSGDYEGAERQARKALELNPRNPDALKYVGLALFVRGQSKDALVYLSDAAAIKPLDGEVQTDLGAALVAQNRLEEGITHLRRALQINPSSAEAWFHLGTAEFRRGDKQEAMDCWREAVDIKPDDNAVRYRLALILAQFELHDQAIAHFQRILGLDPRHTDALVGLAASYAQIGQKDKSLRCLEDALRIARSDGNQQLAEQIAQQIELLPQRPPGDKSGR